MRVLAGDIGGTKTALAIVNLGPASLEVERLETYASAAYAGLEQIVEDFFRAERSRPQTAGFGVAGPVREGSARILPALRRAEFLRAFRSKPPMQDLLSRIPVRVVLDPRLGLFGAAASAYRIAMETTR